jgi:hypothetical protein
MPGEYAFATATVKSGSGWHSSTDRLSAFSVSKQNAFSRLDKSPHRGQPGTTRHDSYASDLHGYNILSVMSGF